MGSGSGSHDRTPAERVANLERAERNTLERIDRETKILATVREQLAAARKSLELHEATAAEVAAAPVVANG